MPEDDGTNDNPDGGDGAGTGGGGSGSGKTFTEAELQSRLRREKDAGASKATSDLAKRLGVPLDQAETIIKDHLAKDQAAMTEAERARATATADAALAAADRAEAARDKHLSRVERLLTAAGSDDPEADAALVSVEVGADPDAIQEAIDALKVKRPALFGGTATTTQKVTDGTTKTRPPTGGQPTKSDLERGRERAKAYIDRQRPKART